MNPEGLAHRGDLDPEAVRLVECLNDLMSGEAVVTALVQLGPRAITPLRTFLLRTFLLENRPSTVYHPRRWAVAALGGLGAVDVLLEYLNNPRKIDDRQLRFAEEPVQNAAIRALAAQADQGIVQFFLEFFKRKMLPSLAEVFGQLQCTAALPFLDRALEDDVCRPEAEEAFRKIGIPARSHLVISATTPQPSIDAETPSSLRRRRSALSLLVDIGIGPEDWEELKQLVMDEDPESFIHLCVLAADAGIQDSRQDLVRRLIGAFPAAPWYLHESVEHCLTAWFEIAEPMIKEEVTRRTGMQQTRLTFDETLRFLSRVLRNGRQRGTDTNGFRETA